MALLKSFAKNMRIMMRIIKNPSDPMYERLVTLCDHFFDHLANVEEDDYEYLTVIQHICCNLQTARLLYEGFVESEDKVMLGVLDGQKTKEESNKIIPFRKEKKGRNS